jgi:hypothetical protein
MPFESVPIAPNAAERAELEQMTQSRMLPAGDVFRARLILLLAEKACHTEAFRSDSILQLP